MDENGRRPSLSSESPRGSAPEDADAALLSVAESSRLAAGEPNGDRPAGWALWRQDDNGHLFFVLARDTRSEVEELREAFEGHHHKQYYFIEPFRRRVAVSSEHAWSALFTPHTACAGVPCTAGCLPAGPRGAWPVVAVSPDDASRRMEGGSLVRRLRVARARSARAPA